MDKRLADMTPEEEQVYINKINEDVAYFLDAVPFVEIGDTSKGKHIKLKSHVHNGTYSFSEIIFELQYNLYRQQQRHPDKNITKLIVSKLELTPHISEIGFNPLRGLMIRMYYEIKE